MREVLLVKLGEIALKGQNRYKFENALFKNIRRRLAPLGAFDYRYAQSTLYIEPKEAPQDGQDDLLGIGAANDPLAAAEEALFCIYGIATIARAAVCEKDFAAIVRTARERFADELRRAGSFKVEAKRADKRFAMKSPEICRELGGELLDAFPHLRVDVHHPDLTIHVEIRDFDAYVHCGGRTGPGGMPVGTSGEATLLLSGGIDSPVAGCMLAKRGVRVSAVHFHSYPYTSERAKQKVLELAGLMARWCGDVMVRVVSFTKIQEVMRPVVPEDMFTIIMRRFMMKIASDISDKTGTSALITGESLAQVASQTMEGLCVTDAAVEKPVFRPLIGLDKSEIVDRARALGTFEKSIEPYEDCCAVFSPKHPDTKPSIEEVLTIEAKLPMEELIAEAVNSCEKVCACYKEGEGVVFRYPRREGVV